MESVRGQQREGLSGRRQREHNLMDLLRAGATSPLPFC